MQNPYSTTMPTPQVAQPGPTEQATHPLMRMDPNLGVAPIQLMALSLLSKNDPMKGLEEFGRLQANSLQRQGFEQDMDISKHNLDLARRQDQRAERADTRQQETHQTALQDAEYERTQRPFIEEMAKQKLLAGALDLKASRMQLQVAEQSAMGQGMSPEDIQRIHADSLTTSQKILSERLDDKMIPVVPTAEEIVKLQNELTTQQLMYLTGANPQSNVTPWNSYTPQQQQQMLQAASTNPAAMQKLMEFYPEQARGLPGAP